jgi:starch synthase
VYALLCPQLYERLGILFGDERGSDWSDNDIRFGRPATQPNEQWAG